MAQHDYDIADQIGRTFLVDLNAALAAIQSNNSGENLPAAAASPTGMIAVRTTDDSIWIRDHRGGWIKLGDVQPYFGLAGIKEIGSNLSLNAAGELSATGGSGGLSQAQVDARVSAGVQDWAEAGNSDLIPGSKLDANAIVDARVAAGVEDWAETGNAGLIPSDKLDTYRIARNLENLSLYDRINVNGILGGECAEKLTFVDPPTPYTSADQDILVSTRRGLIKTERRVVGDDNRIYEFRTLTDDDFDGVFDDYVSDYSTNNGTRDGKFWYSYKYAAFFRTMHVDGEDIPVEYNPFATGNEWATVPSGGTYTGNLLRNYEVVDNEEHAGNLRPSRGDTFILWRERRVVYFDSSSGSGGTLQFRKRSLIPRYFNNPSAEYWGVGQTERWPSNWPNTDDGRSSMRRLRFAALTNNKPHAYWDGGDDEMGNIFLPVADIDSNIDTGGPDLSTYMVFSLPTGRYDLQLVVSRDTSNNDNSETSSIRRIRSGDDDVVLGEAFHYGSGTFQEEDVRASTNILIRDVEINGSDQYYCAATGVSTARNTRHYLHIRRLA